jgi:hypothetical protein
MLFPAAEAMMENSGESGSAGAGCPFHIQGLFSFYYFSILYKQWNDDIVNKPAEGCWGVSISSVSNN